MTQTRTRTPWRHMVIVAVAGGILGAGSGVMMNVRDGDPVDASTSVPTTVSGEQGGQS